MRVVTLCVVVACLIVFATAACSENASDSVEANTIEATVDPTAVDSPELRARLQSSRFLSEETFPAPDSRGDLCLVNWYVDFHDEEVEWYRGEYGTTTLVSYHVDESGHIKAAMPNGVVHDGLFDRTSGRLMWGDRWYVAE